VTQAEKRDLKDRLIDKAETENSTHFHSRQIVFPAENYIRTWHDEITRGNGHLKGLIEEIYDDAREEASMPQNWVTPDAMAMSFASDGVAAVGKGVKTAKELGDTYKEVGRVREGVGLVENAERTEKYVNAYEKVEQGQRVVEGAKTFAEYKELDKEEEEGETKPVFKKSKADIYTELGVELVSQIPGVGGMVKMFAGMFIEIGLSNYSGVVAGIRARIYACFVGGFITGLTLVGDSTLTNKRDKKYYELGLKRGVGMSPTVSFQYQIALMYYAMTHCTSGFWAGTTPEFHGRQGSEWDYPDEWEAKWSPEMLGASLVTMLGFKHYLIE
jgi:hypothetical protein